MMKLSAKGGSHNPSLDPEDPQVGEIVAQALAAALTPVMPAACGGGAALRGRLLQRARDSQQAASKMIMVRRDDGDWRDVATGVRVKVLNDDTAARSVLLEFAAGASLPSHRHHAHEECVVLRGDAQLGDLKVSVGDYHLAPAGSRHGRIGSHSGALLYLRGVSLGSTAEVVRDLITAWLPGKGAAPLTMRASEGEWRELQPGVQTKLLWGDSLECSLLLRMQPGASLPEHSHARHEECLMLSGEAFVGDTLLRKGEFQLAPVGTVHSGVVSDVGALLFVHGAADLCDAHYRS
ncbi:MAG: cupin domain-containing protein [Porticoccaceae bacterium]